MSHLSPLQIAMIVIAAVSIVGVIITSMRTSSTFRGYEEYQKEIAKIATTLKAEMFRDGDDLVLTGNHRKYPIQVRFSYSETTPGLNIRMQAPVSFTFSVVPRGAQATEGRVPIRTGDDMFDAKFTARTNHPTEAKMLVTSKVMRTHMEKLCCSSKTFLTLTTGNIELSELLIPEPYTGRHVLDHVESMGILGSAVENIPGADKVKVHPYVREKSTPVFRIALALGAVTAIIAVFFMQQPEENGALADSTPQLVGIMPADEKAIPEAFSWRAATSDDFHPSVVSWIRGFGLSPEGRFELDLLGTGSRDIGYFLTNPKGKYRIVLLQNGTNVYDSGFDQLVGVVRVPHDRFSDIEWTTKPSEEPLGDAIMVIRGTKAEDLNAMIIFPKNGRVFAGIPSQFMNVSLK